jgi:hypothetical protein
MSSRLVNWLVCLLLAIVAVVAYSPALSAGLVGDDFQLLAQGQLVKNPGWFFSQDHSLSYFYRPVAMCVWWLSAKLFGTDATAQYALQLSLHVINCWLLWRAATLILQRLNVEQKPTHGLAIAIAMLYASHPINIGSGVWLADRFDLLASTGCLWLCCLFVSKQYLARSWQIALAACLAAGSKEIALAALPCLLLLCYWQASAERVPRLLALVTPFVLMLVMRTALLAPVKTTAGIDNIASVLSQGTWASLQAWPVALSWSGWFLLATVLITAIATRKAWRVAAPPQWSIGSKLALAFLSVVGATILLQSPITALSLPHDATLSNPSNLRFFCFALAFLFLAALVVLDQLRDQQRTLVAAIGMAISIWQWIPSRAISQNWVSASAKVPQQIMLDDAIKQIRSYRSSLPAGQSCVVQLLETKLVTEFFAGFADVAIKSQLASDDPAIDCLILTEKAPWYQLLRKPDLAALAPHYRIEYGSTLVSRQFAGLTYAFLRLDYPEHLANDRGVLRLRWRGAGFVGVR